VATTPEMNLLITDLHAKAKDIKVDIDKIRVDLSYERDPSRDLVDRITSDWNIVVAGRILVSDRGERDPNSGIEGGLFLVDGQHRVLSAKQQGIKQLDARVIDLSGHPDPGQVEALLRLHANVGLQDRALERFKAQVRSGNEESLAIQNLLAKFDTEINAVANAEFGINCVSTIERIYRADGTGAILNDTLALIKEVYGEVRSHNAQANLFMGVAWFTVAHLDSGQARRERAVEKMGELTITQLQARARAHASVMGKSLWFNIYRAIVELYNDKLSGKKLEWVSRGAARLGQGSGQAFH